MDQALIAVLVLLIFGLGLGGGAAIALCATRGRRDPYERWPELKAWADAPAGEVAWHNPDRPAQGFWSRLACRLGMHDRVCDGFGWDGGEHCVRCGENFSAHPHC